MMQTHAADYRRSGKSLIETPTEATIRAHEMTTIRIGIVGAGAIGRAFALHVARAGYELVVSNSRGAESLSSFARSLGTSVKARNAQQAAMADIVFLAVPWTRIPQATSLLSSWDGRIVIDSTNPIILPGFQVADLNGKTSSEVVAEQMPGARVIKAFNTLTPAMLTADPKVAGGRRVVFFSGNDAQAKKTVAGLIDTLGYAGVDLGDLSSGGKLQQFPGGALSTLDLIKLD
jgi:predicted dinucleotide-binding enzyme